MDSALVCFVIDVQGVVCVLVGAVFAGFNFVSALSYTRQ